VKRESNPVEIWEKVNEREQERKGEANVNVTQKVMHGPRSEVNKYRIGGASQRREGRGLRSKKKKTGGKKEEEEKEAEEERRLKPDGYGGARNTGDRRNKKLGGLLGNNIGGGRGDAKGWNRRTAVWARKGVKKTGGHISMNRVYKSLKYGKEKGGEKVVQHKQISTVLVT